MADLVSYEITEKLDKVLKNQADLAEMIALSYPGGEYASDIDEYYTAIRVRSGVVGS